jgi:hypothetical protein
MGDDVLIHKNGASPTFVMLLQDKGITMRYVALRKA